MFENLDLPRCWLRHLERSIFHSARLSGSPQVTLFSAHQMAIPAPDIWELWIYAIIPESIWWRNGSFPAAVYNRIHNFTYIDMFGEREGRSLFLSLEPHLFPGYLMHFVTIFHSGGISDDNFSLIAPVGVWLPLMWLDLCGVPSRMAWRWPLWLSWPYHTPLGHPLLCRHWVWGRVH